MLHPYLRTLWVHAAIATALFGAAPAYAKHRAVSRVIVQEAITAATTDVDVKVTRVSVKQGCRVKSAHLASGTEQRTWTFRVAGFTKQGQACEGWAWAKVTPMATALVVSKTLVAGQPLQGSVVTRRVPLLRGETLLPVSATEHQARTRLPKGRTLRTSDVVVAGPDIGSSVTIRLRAGNMVVAAAGIRIPCSARDGALSVCARTASGTKVAGPFEQGALWVRQ